MQNPKKHKALRIRHNYAKPKEAEGIKNKAKYFQRFSYVVDRVLNPNEEQHN